MWVQETGSITPLEVLDSKCIKGVGHDLFLKKAPRRPAPSLTVAAVKHLIRLVRAFQSTYALLLGIFMTDG